MKYKLIKPIDSRYSITQQILTNRNIPLNEISHYLNTSDADINDYNLLGEEKLYQAMKQLLIAIKENKKIALIIDSDCDGFCSSAILLNYLHNIFPTWVENNIKWFFHSGKQHGLEDCIDNIFEQQCQLVICPDGGSNDFKQQDYLQENQIPVIILDHHDIDHDNPQSAIIINIQLNDYPNKQLAGGGVVWQFCRYLDNLFETECSEQYIDLVALACIGDMMSLTSIETKHLISKGLKTENVVNHFILNLWDKNAFKIGKYLTPTNVAFYIVPYINAIVRSGTQAEKEIIFKAMLDYYSNLTILSTKRGHQLNETETIADQAVRICHNVKNRQTKTQNTSLNIFEQKIKQDSLTNHKILLLLFDNEDIDRNIIGLAANRLANQYQRPCCILIKDKNNIYSGSARGYEKTGIKNFKQYCEKTQCIEYAAGHGNAFGLGIAPSAVSSFIQKIDTELQNFTTENIYYVDFIYNENQIDLPSLRTIGELNALWGKDVDEPLIALEKIPITKSMVSLMSPDKNPTLKIILPSNLVLIKFGIAQEEYQKFLMNEYTEINIIGKINLNEWQNNITTQLLITDYDIVQTKKYLF